MHAPSIYMNWNTRTRIYSSSHTHTSIYRRSLLNAEINIYSSSYAYSIQKLNDLHSCSRLYYVCVFACVRSRCRRCVRVCWWVAGCVGRCDVCRGVLCVYVRERGYWGRNIASPGEDLPPTVSKITRRKLLPLKNKSQRMTQQASIYLEMHQKYTENIIKYHNSLST